MKADLPSKEVTLKEILMQWKLPLAVFLSTVFVFALVVATLNPKKVSYAKEYNYLYSVAAAIENGREVNFDNLELKLKKFSGLRPEFDSLFAQKYLTDGEPNKARSVLRGINDRLGEKDEAVDSFTKASLAIEEEELEKAYKHSLEVVKEESCKRGNPVMYAYNLYRMMLLEKMLGYAVTSKEMLSGYLDEIKDQSVTQSGVIAKIQKELEK